MEVHRAFQILIYITVGIFCILQSSYSQIPWNKISFPKQDITSFDTSLGGWPGLTSEQMFYFVGHVKLGVFRKANIYTANPDTQSYPWVQVGSYSDNFNCKSLVSRTGWMYAIAVYRAGKLGGWANSLDTLGNLIKSNINELNWSGWYEVPIEGITPSMLAKVDTSIFIGATNGTVWRLTTSDSLIQHVGQTKTIVVQHQNIGLLP